MRIPEGCLSCSDLASSRPANLCCGAVAERAGPARTGRPMHDERRDAWRLQEKIVLVTGAGAGIGRAIALAMAENGATVAAADIDEAAAQRTASEAPATREINAGRSRSRPIAAISRASTGWWRALSPSSAGST